MRSLKGDHTQSTLSRGCGGLCIRKPGVDELPKGCRVIREEMALGSFTRCKMGGSESVLMKILPEYLGPKETQVLKRDRG